MNRYIRFGYSPTTIGRTETSFGMQITRRLSMSCAFKCLSFRRSYVLLGMHFFSSLSTLFVYVDILSGFCENLWNTCLAFSSRCRQFISRFVVKALRRNIPCCWVLHMFCLSWQNVGPYSRHDRVRGRLLLTDGWRRGPVWGKLGYGLARTWGV